MSQEHQTIRTILTSVKRVLSKLLSKLHEVTLDKRDLGLQAHLLGIFTCAADLEVVVVQADDLSIRELRYLACGTTNTTANVKDTHAGLDAHFVGKVMFMASKRGVEGLPLVEAREMERGTPSILIELGGTVVIPYTGFSVLSSPESYQAHH